MSEQQSSSRWLELALSLTTLVLLLCYTYLELVATPFLGFDFNPDGLVTDVFAVRKNGLEKNDRIIMVNGNPWSPYYMDIRQPGMAAFVRGDMIALVVERTDSGEIEISWLVQDPGRDEIRDRLVNIWPLAYLFWGMGFLTILVVRPRNGKYWLLIAFFFLTAIWLITGSTSRWHLWQSAVVVRFVTWLLVPVYLHLHWLLPRPSAEHSFPLWLKSIYALGIIFALFEWLQLLPPDLFYTGFLVAVVGSLGLLGANYLFRPLLRRQTRFLWFALLLALLPPTLLAITSITGSSPWYAGIALLSFPIIPFAYFYAAFRYQLGDSELRINRLLAIYTYLLIAMLIVALTLSLLGLGFGLTATSIFVATLAAAVTAAIAVSNFGRYSRWLERRLFNITIDPDAVLAAYAAHITRSLERSSLAQLLRDELLPSLLVRQSALLWFREDRSFSPVYIQNLESRQLPTEQQVTHLLDVAGLYLPPAATATSPASPLWVRLALPLHADDELIGLWLLGRRDPDDFYAAAEISLFEALAGYTAIALVNIQQAERLQLILQARIDQRETERTSLSQALHDEVLNDLAQLRPLVADAAGFDKFDRSLAEIVSTIREITWGLRPGALNQGLAFALMDLGDSLSARVEDDVAITVDVYQTEPTSHPEVEQHLYAIVKQACENALRHAQARNIYIRGAAGPDAIDLAVEDDGQGFIVGERLNLDTLLASRHFGLFDMYERAKIIGAGYDVYSTPGEGTRVTVTWEPGQPEFG